MFNAADNAKSHHYYMDITVSCIKYVWRHIKSTIYISLILNNIKDKECFMGDKTLNAIKISYFISVYW